MSVKTFLQNISKQILPNLQKCTSDLKKMNQSVLTHSSYGSSYYMKHFFFKGKKLHIGMTYFDFQSLIKMILLEWIGKIHGNIIKFYKSQTFYCWLCTCIGMVRENYINYNNSWRIILKLMSQLATRFSQKDSTRHYTEYIWFLFRPWSSNKELVTKWTSLQLGRGKIFCKTIN